ncbi:MAG: RNA methyltransferase [Clostridia bacterium]|nr:RNA methyltransferase [Clostridia bacterium]
MFTDITSKDNPTVKQAHKLLGSSHERKSTKMYVIEGQRLCGDALISKARIITLFFTEEAQQRSADLIECLECAAEASYRVTPEVFEKVSDTKHPQGICCVCAMPEPTTDIKQEGRYIALENISDPSNLGTILRTAEAFNFDGAVISGDSCDVYNPKVLRGSMGAVFRLPIIHTDNFPAFMQECKLRGMRPIAAVPDRNAVSITSVRFFRGVLMCIGNEAQGLTEETVKSCGEKVTIPMLGRAESLNASISASILMWEMSRGK